VKVYTKKGDKGETSLFGGGPFPKDHPRIKVYGTVDELASVVGCAVAQLSDSELKPLVLEIQKQLFVVGAELASLNPSEEMAQGFIQDGHIVSLEKQIDGWEEKLEPLKKFILPGGAPAASLFHMARTVCRRAERNLITLKSQEPVREEVLRYLNRLSDWFFVLSREINRRAKVPDLLWEGILNP